MTLVKATLLVLLPVFIVQRMSIAQIPSLSEGANFYDYIDYYYSSPEYNPNEAGEGGPNAQIERLKKNWSERLYPHGNFLVANQAIINYATTFHSIKTREVNPNWTCIGPFKNPTNSAAKGVGQIHRITFDPNYGIGENLTLYASSGYSGLWKSTDDGLNWTNWHTDELPITAVADLAIDPNNSNRMILATGLPDEGITLQYSSNWGLTNPIYTIGMYRSFDGGVTWEPMNNGFLTEFYEKAGTVRELTIHPTDGNIVYAATSNGVYKCSNAFSSNPVWTDISTSLNGTHTDIRSIKLKPDDPNTIYAGTSDIFMSNNGGQSWNSLTGPITDLDFSTLTGFEPYRINLAVTPADPDRIYAFIYGKYLLSDGKLTNRYYVYYFNDGHWTLIRSNTHDYYIAKEWLAIAASPVNPDAVFFYDYGIWGTHDLVNISKYGAYHSTGIYADGHVLEFQPNSLSNPKLFYGHHGGISLGNMSAPNQWQFRNNGLANMLIWSFDESKFKNGTLMIGLQDTYFYLYKDNNWTANPGGGDSYTARSSNTTPNLFYLSNDDHTMSRYNVSTNSSVGETSIIPYDIVNSTERTIITKTLPLINYPNDNYDYFGFGEIYKRKIDEPTTTILSDIWDFDSDIGREEPILWKRQITEFDYCLNHPVVSYIATGGRTELGLGSLLMKTTTGGNNGSWTLPAAYTKIDYPSISQNLYPLISGIACHPDNANKVWISMIGYDNIPWRVAVSNDGGQTWQNADPTNSLPKMPINGIVYQNGTDDLLYAATDAGVYYKDNSMTDWEEYGIFPHVRVHELKINYCDRKLKVATYGRSVWEGDLLDNTVQTYYIVNSNQNLIWDKPKVLKSSIRIKDGGVLTIKSTVNMPQDSKIIVEQGGKLYIEGGILTNECNQSWQGIEVWGNNKEHQWPDQNGHYAQGYINLKNATISNAICAINLMDPNDYNATGGIVYASNSNFINNTQSIHATSYRNFHPITGNEMDYQAHFSYCTFELNADYIADPMFYKHVDLSSIRGVHFEACSFSLAPETPNVNDYNHGIASYSASFSVNAVCNGTVQSPCPETSYDRCTFTGFYYGISSNLLNDAFTGFYVNRANFINNTHGIYVNGINNYIVIRSNFEIGRNKCANIFCSTSPGYGIYSTESYGFAIEENYFTKVENIISSHLIGIFMDNTREVDLIYKNKFDGLSYGNFAIRDNTIDRHPYLGLSYICNENTNNYADFFTPKESLVEMWQGDPTLATGNRFSTNATWHFYNDGVYNLDYYYCSNCLYETPNVAKLNRVNRKTAPANTCPSHYSGDIKLTAEQKINLETEFAQSTNNYNSVKVIYTQLEDGGNTEETITEISTTNSSEMLSVKEELLGKSPHLSEAVLTTVSNKTDVFPDAAIFDILAANPDEMKNEKFIKHLSEKNDPLPQYMIDILQQVSEGNTYKSILQQQMAKHNRKKSNAAMDQIRSILNDTVINYDDLRSWLDNLGGIEADMQIIETYMHEKNYLAANTIAQSLPSIYALEGESFQEYNMFLSLLNLEQDLDTLRTYADLTDNEFILVQSIADSSKGKSGAKAKGIISKYYGGHYYDCITLDENSTKRTIVNPNALGKVYGLNISCSPNPAGAWTAFDYSLPENQTTATLRIFNGIGKLIFEKQLSGPTGQYIWDIRKQVAGQYLYVIECGSFRQSDKITIIK